ncbi:hypothetical protein BJ684DRAFT_14532 [Piptocephalis cylindrospora]|uniref:Rho-GAP domain-containing protein n=1 Tax=Piptocephalis cylindrospora TaxID=1907219 RepID=A0A4V1IYN6_9FUNG|nr:hypothetical protein BJ684DRAFT_14532 [Piptocephalis cylindrospora]|eukprot:RKP15189.1 hypothetical protein BJ684DRAFT_14532 [Piptocephalis cylindrospora]
MSLWRRALFLTGMGSEVEGDPEEVLASNPDRLTEWVNTKVLYQAGMNSVCADDKGEKASLPRESSPPPPFHDGMQAPIMKVDQCLSFVPVNYPTRPRRILIKLDELVENDYTLVFFSGGAKYRPGWAWLFKSYQQMSRNYKKNLKHLYIVHPSMWARIMIDMMSAVVSNKFYKKLTYVPTLSDLAVHVPLKEMRLPDAIYEYNFKFEPAVRSPPQARPRKPLMFCRPLEEVMEGDGGLPRVVDDCIKYIREHGLDVEGIFRRSPSSSALKAARGGYDRGERVDLEEYDEHVAAVLLKLFLRELPSPLFPPPLYGLAKEAFPPGKSTATHEEMAEAVARSGILLEMGGCEREILRAVTGLLGEVTRHMGTNGMTSRNLTIVFAPNLTRGPDPVEDMTLSQPGGSIGRFFMLCIDGHDLIFPQGKDPLGKVLTMGRAATVGKTPYGAKPLLGLGKGGVTGGWPEGLNQEEPYVIRAQRQRSASMAVFPLRKRHGLDLFQPEGEGGGGSKGVGVPPHLTVTTVEGGHLKEEGKEDGEGAKRMVRKVPSTPGLKGLDIPARNRTVSVELEARSLPHEVSDLRHSMPPLVGSLNEQGQEDGRGGKGEVTGGRRRRTKTFML